MSAQNATTWKPAITPELVAKRNLAPDEYARAKAILDAKQVLASGAT